MVTLYLFFPFFIRDTFVWLYLFHPRRRIIVVDGGIVTGKALRTEEFFGVKGSIWFTKLCMSFRGYLPQTMICSHICIAPEGCRLSLVYSDLHDTYPQSTNALHF